MSAKIDYSAALLAWLGSAEKYLIHEGDSAVVTRSIPDASIDAVVADPPAGIAFMGKTWDEDKGGKEHWISWLAGILEEAFRALKPGGRMALWALPQTAHWTAEAGERAGFEVESKIFHLFGSGFPKSTNVSKALDAAAGAEREVIGERKARVLAGHLDVGSETIPTTIPTTPEARQWFGFGTALKPAAEEWIFFRKPIDAITSDELRAATGWDHWCFMRRMDTDKQRAKAAKKWGVVIPDGGELQARTLKALHSGVPMREELRWRPAKIDKSATIEKAMSALNLIGDQDRATIAALVAKYDRDGGERVYSEVGEWQILWSDEKPYKRWSTSSVAANVLRHGTGGLNIDACRAGADISRGDRYNGKAPGGGGSLVDFGGARDRAWDTPAGRWPANLVLSHTAWEETHCPCGAVLSFVARFCPECGSAAVTHRRAGCCAVGERRVKGFSGCNRGDVEQYGNDFHPRKAGERIEGHADPDGLETVTAWECLATCACGLSTLAPSGGAPPRCRCGRAMAWACPVARLDEQSGTLQSGFSAGFAGEIATSVALGAKRAVINPASVYADTGGASRFFNTFAPPDDTEPFFWCAKPSAAETEAGCERLPIKSAAENVDREGDSAGMQSPRAGAGRTSGRRNHHPTRKGIKMMRHFCRLVTPPGGIVLDMFAGSGTTVCAGVLEGFRVIAVEREAEFTPIIRARAAFWARLAGTKVATVAKPRPTREKADTGQGSLF